LHAFHHGNALTLSNWASRLSLPSSQVYFFNFLASHDGIGLTPARGLIAEDEILRIAERVEALGGFVSYRNNPDGSQRPYELNISYVDALGEPGVEEPAELVDRRFLAAQAILLTLRGVPGIYFHSLFGSRSWVEGVEQSGHKRRINRQKLQRGKLLEELSDEASFRARVFRPFAQMLRKRSAEPAFHPSGGQEIVAIHPALFALWRRSLTGDRQVLCLQNVANETIAACIDLAEDLDPNSNFIDLLSDRQFSASDGRLAIEVAPYGVFWLRLIQG
jgi:sucrose phosphorylase